MYLQSNAVKYNNNLNILQKKNNTLIVLKHRPMLSTAHWGKIYILLGSKKRQLTSSSTSSHIR